MQEPRIIFAAVLKENDEIDTLKLGRIAHDKRCSRTLSPQDTAIWNHLAENGSVRLLVDAARQYEDQGLEQVRQRGGTIVQTTSLHGRTTTTRRTYPPRQIATTVARVRPCARVARPRERRSAASSSSSSQDPGSDSDLPAPASPLRLAPRPPAVYTFGVLTAEQRGEVVV